MPRNPVDLGRDALRDPGEVRRVRLGERISTLGDEFLQFLVSPPRLRDVMIREETSIPCHEESCAKEISLQRWSRSVCFERYQPLFVHQRLARSIRGNTNYLSGIFIPKLHHHVQQADAGAVPVNYGFRNPALSFQPVQAVLSLLKLLVERFAVCLAV